MRLCNIEDIADGAARGFATPAHERKIIVVRRGADVHGWLDACPHYGGSTSMAYRRDAYLSGDRRHLACYAHGALFDIVDGACVQGPCLGMRLRRVPLRITERGDIELAGEPEGEDHT